MSETNLNRQKRIRRNVVALVSAVSLACGAVAVPQVASAYVNQTFSPNLGPEEGSRADVTVEVSRSVEHPEQTPNQPFEYNVKVRAVAPQPVQDPTFQNIGPGQSAIHADGAGSVFELQFIPDKNTPLTNWENPGFSWTGLADGIEPILLEHFYTPEANLYTYRFVSNLPKSEGFQFGPGWLGNDVTLEAKFGATAKEGLDPNTSFAAEAQGTAAILPTPVFEHNKSVKLIDKCTIRSTHTHTLKGEGYGTWLRDVKLGSNFPEGNNVTIGEPKLKISNTGRGLTNPVDTAVFNSDDGDAPAEYTLSANLRNQEIDWMKSWNWEFDPTTRTGSQWIADGTTFEVEHDVRNLDCAKNPDSYLGLEPRKIANSTLNIATEALPRMADNNAVLKWESVQLASVGDRIWLDANKDGIQDSGEKDFDKEVTVRVLPPEGSDEKIREVTTTNGRWEVTDLTPGVQYTVEFVLPDGYQASKANQGSDRGQDSNGEKSTVTLEPGEFNKTYDFGVHKVEDAQTSGASTTKTPPSPQPSPGVSTTSDEPVPPVTGTEKTSTATGPSTTPTLTETDCDCEPTTETVTTTTTETEVINDSEAVKIGDKVFIDKNGNGKQDEDETEGVGGITVVITNTETGNVSRTVTDKDGNWKAIGKPGSYEVAFETGRRVASDPKLVTRTVTLKPGEENFDIDLPILPEGTVGDFVWNDANGDGKQDQGEEGVPNVVVKVSRDGEPSRFAVTDKDGKWNIEGLTPNVDYTVTYIQPEGWKVTGKVPNSDSAGLTTTITLKPGEANNDIDLGIQRDTTVTDAKPGTLGGIIWLDSDRNGGNDGKEQGYEGIEVRIYEPGKTQPFKTTTTDKGGSWLFTGLDQNVDYRVEYNIPDGFDVTKQPDNTTIVNNKVELNVTLEGSKPVDLEYDFGVGRSSTVVTKTVTTTVTAPTETTTESKGSSSDVLERCWANAVGSPLLYLTPIALLGALGGKLAEPYLGVVNQQLAQFNAQIQDAINRNTPDWGIRGRDGNRNDPFAGFRAQIDAANREMARIANDPQTRQLGAIAAGLIGLIAAGAVVYDWCSNEVGDAVTSSSKGDRATKPSTATEPAAR